MNGVGRNILLFFVLTVFYTISHHLLLEQRGDLRIHKQNKSSTWLLPSIVLEAVAGEFKGLVADLIVLDAGAQLGTEVIGNPEVGYKTISKNHDWENIHHLFVNSQRLDPRFQHTYVIAQGILPWEAKMIDETQSILHIAAQSRPWDWRPLHFVGFNTYYFLNRAGDAGKIFLEAGKIPKAPSFLAIVGARLAQKGGKTEDAIALMKIMLHGKTEDDEGYQQMADRLEALKGVRLIEVALDRFEKKDGRKPNNLEELIDAGFLKEQPFNPYQLDYCIDSVGKVYFDEPKCGFVQDQQP